mmetsp:Transcript_77414/g.129198  ORF Transcript_77414/g.129198 Transcript_77414/m.129198 type:complete len:217 (-) Transcript_77414:1124-1774(-)
MGGAACHGVLSGAPVLCIAAWGPRAVGSLESVLATSPTTRATAPPDQRQPHVLVNGGDSRRCGLYDPRASCGASDHVRRDADPSSAQRCSEGLAHRPGRHHVPKRPPSLRCASGVARGARLQQRRPHRHALLPRAHQRPRQPRHHAVPVPGRGAAVVRRLSGGERAPAPRARPHGAAARHGADQVLGVGPRAGPAHRRRDQRPERQCGADAGDAGL